MTRVIRSLLTKKYLCHGKWTEDRTSAETFPNSYAAINECITDGIYNVELILQLGAEPNEAFDERFRLL